MRKAIFPRPLQCSSTVAIYAPSYPGAALFPKRLERGIHALENIGFRVYVPDMTFKQHYYTTGTAVERAHELMRLFADDSVQGIICAIGGFNSNDILPYLDYKFIAQHPKVLVGYSDVTALLAGIYAQTGLITFHGPALLPQWGEYPVPFPYTVQCFQEVVSASNAMSYRQPAEWTNVFHDWATDEDEMPRAVQRNDTWQVLREGKAEGRLLGGNIETLNFLIGTPYCPDFTDCLLFIEATDSEAYLPRIQRSFAHLAQAGVLAKAKALIVGKCPDAKPMDGQNLANLLLETTDDLDLPIVLGCDIGHTDPQMTIPIGVLARLNCLPGTFEFVLLENATQN